MRPAWCLTGSGGASMFFQGCPGCPASVDWLTSHTCADLLHLPPPPPSCIGPAPGAARPPGFSACTSPHLPFLGTGFLSWPPPSVGPQCHPKARRPRSSYPLYPSSSRSLSLLRRGWPVDDWGWYRVRMWLLSTGLAALGNPG